MQQFLEQAFGANGVIGPEDRAQAVSALSDRLGVPEDQLRQTIDNWQAQFTSGPGLEARINALQAETARTTDQAADAVGDAALWTALGLLVALAASIGGGITGRPKIAGAPHARVPHART